MIFASPIFLIGLVAVAVPIAIHLLQLRRYRKVYFSNVDALEELHNESRQRNRLRQLLILAMRILVVLFLVLAFCRPVLPHKDSSLKAGGTAVSVYIDNSYSMESGGMDGSLVESARHKAREIAAAYRPGDRYQLLTNDASGSQFRWLSREEFLTAVDDFHPTAVTAPMSALMRRQNDFLRSTTVTNRHAYVISDFQRSTADIADLPVDSAILTTFVPLEGSNVANLYIDSIAFDCPSYCLGAAVTAEVRVCNGGDKAVESLPLRLFAGGRQRALSTVDIAAHSHATVPLHFTIEEQGVLQGYVETTDYPVTFDDRLYFTLSVARQIPVLAIAGAGENPFLDKLFRGDSLVRYRVEEVSRIDYTTLTDNSLIVLDRVASVTSGLAQTLQTFVQEGGSLLVVPAAQADRESYNHLLEALHAPRLGDWRPGAVKALEVNYQSPLYRGVFNSRPDDVEMPTVIGSYLLESDATTVREPVVSLANGSDYLTLTRAGEGTVYLFASPLQKEHGDFVQQALFVPTVYNMALFSTPQQAPFHWLTDRTAVPLAGRYDGEAAPHLTNDDGSVDLIPDLRRMGGRYCMVPHGEIVEAGNYRLGGDEGMSFNFSRRESDLTFYNPSELDEMLGSRLHGGSAVVGQAQKSMTDYVRQRGQGTPLWRWCLLLALVALLAETLLVRLPQKTR